MDKKTRAIFVLIVALAFMAGVLFMQGLSKNIVTQTQTVSVNSAPAKLNINNCGKQDLISMGIGNNKADLILANRPYATLKEIEGINGIGSKTIQLLANKIEF